VLFTALPALEHAQATLRPLTRNDIEPWYRILRQPAVYEHTSWNLTGPEDLLHYLTAPSENSAVRFALARRDSDALIGTIGFHSVSMINRTAELAYDLAPEYWGMGIARAACNAVCAWALGPMGLVRVQATTLIANTRSIRVLEACGFAHEGLLRRYRMVRGTPGDFNLYSKLS
jgi:[ribosomal protein S5]-alanine N-acetyltransferase